MNITVPFSHNQHNQLIAISASFTAEPLKDTLEFWLQLFDFPSNIEFAPYNQIFQQLIGPTSIFANNENGINVILLNFEDWLKYKQVDKVGNDSAAEECKKIERHAHDLVNAIKSSAKRSATPHLVCICPSSPETAMDNYCSSFFSRLEKRISSELEHINGVYLISSEYLFSKYPVAAYYDSFSESLGHIPYTPLFFTSLATMIARKIHAIKSIQYKVIVLDCDQTLWKGVVGEDGVTGIKIDPPRKKLQEFMVAQHDTGMLISLCSKNNDEDVRGVFDYHSEMPLKLDHIVSRRINWLPKSENIKLLSEELQLGLNSFIFIDDNPVECAEVQANCPEVLTLQLPTKSDEITSFLEHVWAFDRINVTSEDKGRASFYKQSIKRQHFQDTFQSFSEFIKELDLSVTISEATSANFSRVSQLTQRTNQFNVTTIRRSESEIQQLSAKGFCCLTITVKDRFGDYGLVGVIIFQNLAATVKVDSFILSCRTLGRGVEHQMLAELGKIAITSGCKNIDIPFLPTKKNQPAFDFLNEIGARYKTRYGQGWRFSFPAKYAAAVTFSDKKAKAPPLKKQKKRSAALSDISFCHAKSKLYQGIATELNNIEQISNSINSQKQRMRAAGDEESYVAASSPSEMILTKIWCQFLRLDKVGIHDNFFDLGGDSILSIQIASSAAKEGIHFEPSQLFQFQTIAELEKNCISEKPVPDEQGIITGVIPLAPLQLRFFDQWDADPNLWCTGVIRETFQQLDASRLEVVIQHLLMHHDALRMRFDFLDSGWQQVNAPNDDHIHLSQHDLSGLSREKQLHAIQKTLSQLQTQLNLSRGPLIQAALFDCDPHQSQYFAIIIHNLVMDSFSWPILLSDLETGYKQLTQGEELKYASKTTSFKHTMQLLFDYAQSESLRSELNYWISQFKPIVSQLPHDFTVAGNTLAPARSVSVSLNFQETHSLLCDVSKAYRTNIQEVLLLALLLSVTEYTGETSLLIDIVSHSRIHILENVDLSLTIGPLTATFPTLLELKGNTIGDQLKTVKEQLRNIPNGGTGYSLLRFLCNDKDVRTNLSSQSQPPFSFNYPGDFDQISADSPLMAQAKDFNVPDSLNTYLHRDHLLEIFGFISQKQLQMHWFYNSQVYRQVTVQKLAQKFIEILRSVIEYCRSHQDEGYTPSDFSEADLTQEELDRLIAGIDDSLG